MTHQVYLLRVGKTQMYKIGQVNGNIELHRQELQNGNPQELTFEYIVKTKYPDSVRRAICEYLIHEETPARRHWFKLDVNRVRIVKNTIDSYVDIAEINGGNIANIE